MRLRPAQEPTRILTMIATNMASVMPFTFRESASLYPPIWNGMRIAFGLKVWNFTHVRIVKFGVPKAAAPNRFVTNLVGYIGFDSHVSPVADLILVNTVAYTRKIVRNRSPTHVDRPAIRIHPRRKKMPKMRLETVFLSSLKKLRMCRLAVQMLTINSPRNAPAPWLSISGNLPRNSEDEDPEKPAAEANTFSALVNKKKNQQLKESPTGRMKIKAITHG